MKKLVLIFALGFQLILLLQGQSIDNPKVSQTNCKQCEIIRIEINKDYTFVYLRIQEKRSNMLGPYVTIGSNTYLFIKDTNIKLKILGLANDLKLDQIYRTKKGEFYDFVLAFQAMPPGFENLDIIEETSDGSGFEWKGIKINNPDNSPKTNWNEINLKLEWEKNGINSLEGIYEQTIAEENSPKYRLALKFDKLSDQYQLIYLGGAVEPVWNVGDIKAIISKTASPNIFKVRWYMGYKTISEDLYLSFEQGLMKIIWTNGNSEQLYLKLFPTSTANVETKNNFGISGSGFAISENGYIVTNQHIINGSTEIKVRGIKGNFTKAYNAELLVEDKNNDIAVIKINDPDFTTIGIPPYQIIGSISDVGLSVWALGYPLRATMGDEVKLTNGIISSKTGFQGDITTYQISVPVQPGNSGGPLFDSKGNIIGIISAKHLGTENVAYAIKSSYLLNLLQVMNTAPILPTTNSISNKNLTEQVKFVKEFVYIIEVN